MYELLIELYFKVLFENYSVVIEMLQLNHLVSNLWMKCELLGFISQFFFIFY